MDKRWTLFLMITIMILMVFNMKVKQRQLELAKKQAAQLETEMPSSTSQTGEDTGTTATISKPGETASLKTREKDIEAPGQAETLIPVRTDLFVIELSTRGGRPSRWDLINTSPLQDRDKTATQAISLIEHLGVEQDRELPLELDFREYNAVKTFSMINRMILEHETITRENGDVELLFNSPSIEGMSLTKRYVFHQGSYMSDFSVTLNNLTDSNITIDDGGRGLGVSWGPGLGLVTSVQDPYEKRYISSVYCLQGGKTNNFRAAEKVQEISGDIMWGGQNTRFLLAVIIPLEEKGASFSSVVRSKNLLDQDGNKRSLPIQPATSILWLKKTILPSHGSKTFSFKIYTGPRNYSLLKKSGYELASSMFYTHWGWLRFLCIILLYILKWLNGLLHNYGGAIIGLTILVRIVTYPLTHKGMKLQAKAMAEQAKLRPYIEEINEKYKNNPQMKNKKVMDLYKEHGINPLGFLRGCLPLLIQMPIFISLYFLLSETFELKGEKFLWIRDLSAPDKLVTFGMSFPVIGRYLNLLPILMGVSQIFVSKYSSSTSADPNQKTMMYFFPIFFMFIVYNLSSGLVLYWLVSNILQAGQQMIINKHMKQEGTAMN